MSWIDPLWVMMYRELKRFFRAKSRLIGSIINPLIWAIFFGLGWSSAFNFPQAKMIFGGVDYITYLAPGIVMMTVFTASFISGVTVLWDKQFGFLKEVLVAPTPREPAIIGRALGGSITAILQGLIVFAVLTPMVSNIRILGVLPIIIVGILIGISFSAVGIALATKMSSMEGFHIISSFIMMPTIFLSGAFYPISTMPEWMKILAYINPLTYGVDLTRYYLTGIADMGILKDFVVLIALTAITVTAAALEFRKATIE